ncbi:hypothetical protein HAX54_031964 [Datura stramonium]|uniref:Uncharacterized protein n=1 Tax=Datura stramonium TaxID=4076 RepID=A0ABS8V9X8_DATST|nr:hypothetical protein [Datura stramonium]
MAWLTGHQGPDSDGDNHQTIDGPSLGPSLGFWVQGLTVDLTDHQRSDGPSLLPSNGGFKPVFLDKGDGTNDEPSGG